METNKVIIMQVDKNFTTAYTSDGQFIKVHRKSWHEVGKVLSLIDLEGAPHNNSFVLKLATTAAIAILFVFLGIFNPFLSQKVEAEAETYLSLGLNTGGIQIWADYNNKVIMVSYSDSTSHLDQMDIKGKDIYEVITIITTEARKTGLLTENMDDLLLVDLVNLTEKSNDHVQEAKLKEFIMAGLNYEEYKGTMIMSRHNKEYLEKAIELNLSASEYHIYEKSTAEGYSLSHEQFKHGHIRSVLNEVGTTPEKIFKMDHMQNNETNKASGMHEDNEMRKESIDNTERKMDQQQYNEMHKNYRDYELGDEPIQEEGSITRDHPGSMKMPTEMEMHK